MSKPVTVSIPHALGRAEARRRIEDGFGEFAKHLGAGGLSKSWTGDRMDFALNAMGQSITGMVDVADDAVAVEVLLPGFLAMMADKVKGRLKTEGQLLLERK
jgi:putative polyhydroxyalkanoate system protein